MKGFYMNRYYVLMVGLLFSASVAQAILDVNNTKVTVTNASSKDIPYVRIKVKFTDVDGVSATGSLFIENFASKETRIVDVKDAMTGSKQKKYKKTGVEKKKVAGPTVAMLGELAAVSILRIKPLTEDKKTGYGSRAKFKGGTTTSSFAIADNLG